MKTKFFTLFTASIFALILLANFASATTLFSDDFSSSDLSAWTITNNPITLPGTQWTLDTTNKYVEAAPGASLSTGISILEKTISTVDYKDIVVKYNRQLIGFDIEEEFNVSWTTDGVTYTVLEETGTSTPDDTTFIPRSFNLPSQAEDNLDFKLRIECQSNAADDLCRLDNVLVEGTEIQEPQEITECSATGDNGGDLEIKIDDINNKGFSGKEFGKDDEWFLLDEIEVDIEVKNNNDDDKIKDIEISWGLYNKDTGDWYIDDEENDFNLNDGDDKTITISFKLDDDIDELAEGDYTLYVWANGKINDDSKTPVCASDFDDGISIVSDESDFVVLYDIQIPEISQCDSQVQITADVWNIGDDEQEKVNVRVYNYELGIDEVYEIGDIDEFDSKKLDILITIPKDAKEKSYNLIFEVRDEDNDVYENDFDDDKSEFDRELRIEGNCKVEVTAKATVSAEMSSGGKAGESLVIKVTIENTGDDTTTYTINPASYSTWASSADIDSNTFTLDKGKSKEVLITLNVKKDVSGEKTFSIELLSENQLVTTQPVSVAIEDSSFFSKLSGESNAWLWGIGFLNIVLVVIIILVAVRIVKK